MKTLEIASHVEIDVRRPSGEVETIMPAGRKAITAGDFAKMKAATKAAGRGDLLAYRNVIKTVEDTIATDPSYIADRSYVAERNAISRVSATGR